MLYLYEKTPDAWMAAGVSRTALLVHNMTCAQLKKFTVSVLCIVCIVHALREILQITSCNRLHDGSTGRYISLLEVASSAM